MLLPIGDVCEPVAGCWCDGSAREGAAAKEGSGEKLPFACTSSFQELTGLHQPFPLAFTREYCSPVILGFEVPDAVEVPPVGVGQKAIQIVCHDVGMSPRPAANTYTPGEVAETRREVEITWS